MSNSMTPKYWSIVAAAGKGSRMESPTPKQYLPLQGKPVIEHSLNALLSYPLFERVVVVISSDDTHWHTTKINQHPKVVSTFGGRERFHSVLKGLQALKGLASPQDWILVHDAARPCLQVTDIQKLITEVADHAVGGLLGVPMVDTVKCVIADRSIASTVDRRDLWHAYSPQLFRYQILCEALQSAMDQGCIITDEASAIELMGLKSLMVEGRRDNIKITTPTDLTLAAAFLNTG